MADGDRRGRILAAVSVLGGLIILLANTGVTWATSSTGQLSFGGVRAVVRNGAVHQPGLAIAYFSWLVWVLAAVGVLSGLVSTGGGRVSRVVTLILAGGGAVTSVLAYRSVRLEGFGLSGVTPGLVLVVLGFLVIGAATAVV